MVKLERRALECVEEKFLKIPNVEKYEAFYKVYQALYPALKEQYHVLAGL